MSVGLSFDQRLREPIEAFLRITRPADDAAVTYGTDIADGFHVSNRAWGRAMGNIGSGYVHLYGDNRSIDYMHAAEIGEDMNRRIIPLFQHLIVRMDRSTALSTIIRGAFVDPDHKKRMEPDGIMAVF